MEILKKIGLTSNQIKVYKYLLSEKKKSGAEIARELKLDKSSTYRALDKLNELNLVTQSVDQGVYVYTAANPKILNQLMEEKKARLEQDASQLDVFVKKLIEESGNSNEFTRLKIETGPLAQRASMERSIKDANTTVRQTFTSDSPVYDYPGYKEFIDDFIKRRIKKNVFTKQLVKMTTRYYLDDITVTSEELCKEVRIKPYGLPHQHSFKIYGDNVDIVIYDKDPEKLKVIHIQDKVISTIMAALFDFVWDRSIVYYGKQVLPQKKLTHGVTLPVLGVGTWGVGGYVERNPYNDDINDIDQLKHSISLGQTYIDTCLMYGGGYSLDLIAKAIANFPREQLFITSKFTWPGKIPVSDYREVEKQCDIYLEKLGIDYIDMYQVHGPKVYDFEDEILVSEIEKLIAKGKVRYWGTGNFEIEQLKKLVELSDNLPVAHELEFNLIEREIKNKDNSIVEYCREKGILMIAFKPIARGALFGLGEDESKTTLMSKLTKKYKKSSGQIAINWLCKQPGMIAILKSTNGSHINENVDSFDFEISEEDLKLLDNYNLYS
ncbi:aldo/keto reductase [Candidatus Dojkabacteria bacterium]|uniref:Aldo/keto reductase n=1 Tax=Candidatus Dojkabacteria bacterium TaxID=2099670 RepID=A0A955L515_9BACT|nr:aldo/keto reductase [Candidatus Dojkabacteria bacterium]